MPLVIHAAEPAEDGGLVLHYSRVPEDIRKNGLIWQHSVVVPSGTDYDDELEAVTEALQALLLDVLDDEPRVEHVDPEHLAPEEDPDE